VSLAKLTFKRAKKDISNFLLLVRSRLLVWREMNMNKINVHVQSSVIINK